MAGGQSTNNPGEKNGTEKVPQEVKVFLVDGNLVRELYDTDWVEGGNGFVYGFIPKDEIWIDKDLHPHEVPFIVYHEAVESRHMAQGDDYNTAHKKASAAEFRLRRKMCALDEDLNKVHEMVDVLGWGGL